MSDYVANNRDEGRAARILAAVIGAVYLIIGVVGFFITGFDNFATHNHETLLGFEINPLHNIVHVLIGVAGLVLSRNTRSAGNYGLILAVVYGLTFLYGLFVAGGDSHDNDSNFLSLNGADNVLHLLTAALGVLLYFLARRALPARRDTPGRGDDVVL